MPTEAFLKLDNVKKKNIIDAAKLEFSNYSYEEASINRIIKSIDMPRGTFYLYFENKDDLYDYIFFNYKNQLDNLLEEELIKNNGNIFKMYKSVFKIIVNNTNDNITSLMKKYFVNMNNKRNNSFFPESHKKKELPFITDNVNCEFINREEVDIIIEIIMPIFFHDIAYALINGNLNNEIEKFNKKIDIIENGIKKEGKNNV